MSVASLQQTVAKFSSVQKTVIRLGGLMGASAVTLAAIGSHGSATLDANEELQPIFEKTNKMHFIHALAMFAVPFTKYPIVSGGLVFTGTVLFCGPLYYRCFTNERTLSRFGPYGGGTLIIAWLSMVL